MSDIVAPDVVLVGSAPVDTKDLTKWRGKSQFVAVDGGLNWLMQAGLQPDTVLGDLDSADPGHVETCRAAGIPTQRISDQNSTDLEKALTRYPTGTQIGYGFLDGRIDHSLAALHALVHAGGVDRTLLIGAYDALIVCAGQARFSLPEAARISIWPIGHITFESSTGLVWPLDGLTLEVGVQTGTSNRAIGGDITITPDDKSHGAYAILVDAADWDALYEVVLS